MFEDIDNSLHVQWFSEVAHRFYLPERESHFQPRKRRKSRMNRRSLICLRRGS